MEICLMKGYFSQHFTVFCYFPDSLQFWNFNIQIIFMTNEWGKILGWIIQSLLAAICSPGNKKKKNNPGNCMYWGPEEPHSGLYADYDSSQNLFVIALFKSKIMICEFHSNTKFFLISTCYISKHRYLNWSYN